MLESYYKFVSALPQLSEKGTFFTLHPIIILLSVSLHLLLGNLIGNVVCSTNDGFRSATRMMK